jgi:hypothetical protein
LKEDDEERDAVLLENFTFFDKHKRMVYLPSEYTEDDIFGAGKAYIDEDGPTNIAIGPIHQYAIELGDPDG